MFENGSRPKPWSPVGLLGGNAVVTRESAKSRPGQIDAINSFAANFGKSALLKIGFQDQHLRQLAQKNFRESGFGVNRRIQHAISAARIIKAAFPAFAEMQARLGGTVN